MKKQLFLTVLALIIAFVLMELQLPVQPSSLTSFMEKGGPCVTRSLKETSGLIQQYDIVKSTVICASDLYLKQHQAIDQVPFE